MTQEEKAKAYDEAVERLRNAFYDNNSRMCEEYRNAVLKIIEPIFPELAESEDERIRKELLDYCKNRAEKYPNDPKYNNISAWIAWLEKQGEKIDIANKEYWRGYREGKQEILDKYAELGMQVSNKAQKGE